MNAASQKTDIVLQSSRRMKIDDTNPSVTKFFCELAYLHFFLAIFAAIRIGSQTDENGGA